MRILAAIHNEGFISEIREDKDGRVYFKADGDIVEGVVADAGPQNKVGEISIQGARLLGIPHSPRNGGEDWPLIQYELWPGVPAKVDGVTFALQRSNGTHIIA